MIVLGIVLILLAWLVGIPILWTLGVVLVVIGLVLLLLGGVGHPFMGRQYWF